MQTGFLDSIDGLLLRGWAFDDQAKEPAVVDVCFNGTAVATVRCDELRPDLVTARIGNGRHGFCRQSTVASLGCLR